MTPGKGRQERSRDQNLSCLPLLPARRSAPLPQVGGQRGTPQQERREEKEVSHRRLRGGGTSSRRHCTPGGSHAQGSPLIANVNIPFSRADLEAVA
jgi:hypothetical protein